MGWARFTRSSVWLQRKAAEDSRTPRPRGLNGTPKHAPASWSAAVLCRFQRVMHKPADTSKHSQIPAFFQRSMFNVRCSTFVLISISFLFAGHVLAIDGPLSPEDSLK